MKRVATAVALIPIVLVLILRAPQPLLAAVVAAVAVLTVREMLQLSERYGVQPLRWPTYALVVLVFAAVAVGRGTPSTQEIAILLGTGVLCAFAPFVFATFAMPRQDLRTAFPAGAVSVFALTSVALPLAFLVQLRGMWVAAVPGTIWILYLLAIVWSGDTFAMYAGKAFGRHKMSPRISPGKTWEGAAASLIGSVAVGTFVYSKAYAISTGLERISLIDPDQAYRNVFEPTNLAPIILLSAFINIAAQLGDLVESLIKRGAGVKDSGSLLPGHGGMYDRIDALLFAAPVLWVYAVLHVLYAGN
ncbi:MAG TPA: phosphatidate cytidylyltransferase [Terriglobales bacterium]|nr:phosphatidate cytidylyltransferase [Terriglobales bacterium]